MDGFRYLLKKVHDTVQTKSGKLSVALWVVLGIFYFIYFVFACIQADHAAKRHSFRVWSEEQASIQFPEFVLCPEYPEGLIATIECRILQPNPNNPLITPTVIKPGTYSQWNPDFTCYGYNMDGAVPIGNHTVWCRMNATNGPGRPQGNVQVFFVKPDTKVNQFLLDCDDCIDGQDNYVMPWGTLTTLGLELYFFEEVPRYETYGFSYPVSNFSYNIEGLFSWHSHYVWYYNQHNYYNFWQWMAFIGGAAFLMKILHDLIVSFCDIFIFKETELKPLYEPVK
jgi:hypothetical protein